MIETRQTIHDGKLLIFKNESGGIVSMQGQLPNGQHGYWIDLKEPFTDAELEDVGLLEKHLNRLTKAVDKQMKEARND